MDSVNKESEKEGKRLAQNTPDGKDKTQAEKNVEKFKKSSDYNEPKETDVKPIGK